MKRTRCESRAPSGAALLAAAAAAGGSVAGSADRLRFELGASDFLVKPASPELVVAKVGQLLPGGTKRPRVGGFGGSLKDMGLPDVVQALSNGRKTGRLQIVSGGTVGEIHFLEGAVADASYGARAREDAIYAMLALKDGDFMLDPSFRPASRRMQGSIEALLLEGMRRMDEGLI